MGQEPSSDRQGPWVSSLYKFLASATFVVGVVCFVSALYWNYVSGGYFWDDIDFESQLSNHIGYTVMWVSIVNAALSVVVLLRGHFLRGWVGLVTSAAGVFLTALAEHAVS